MRFSEPKISTLMSCCIIFCTAHLTIALSFEREQNRLAVSPSANIICGNSDISIIAAIKIEIVFFHVGQILL